MTALGLKLAKNVYLWYENIFQIAVFNPIQDGHFRGCSRMGGGQKGPFPKICRTYPALMKLSTVIPNLKKIQKVYESRDAPTEFC